MSRIVFSLVLLLLIYLFMLASFDPWDIVIGVILSAGVLWLFREFLFGSSGDEQTAGGPSLLMRILYFPILAWAVIVDITRGTWAVAAVVVGIRPLREPGIVKVPIGERTRIGVVVSSMATTLSPGSFLVDIDWTDRVMLIHVIDARDPDEVRAGFQTFYERYQRNVFP